MTEIRLRDGVDVRNYEVATGSGALAESTTYPGAFELEEVRIHVGVAAASAENLTVTIDAAAGAAYDTLIKTIAMAGVENYVWAPDKTCLLKAGDQIDIAWTNTDARTWGLTYVYRRIG